MTNNTQPTQTAPNLAATSLMPQYPHNSAGQNLLGAPSDRAQVQTQYNPAAFGNQLTGQSTEPHSLGQNIDQGAVPHQRYESQPFAHGGPHRMTQVNSHSMQMQVVRQTGSLNNGETLEQRPRDVAE